jgi:predicted PhzF superfamily epimerase YddE/YHI9
MSASFVPTVTPLRSLAVIRPGRIFVRASRHDNRVVNVRVGGNAVEVMRGEVFF